jgi:hypothetical protein
LNRPAAIAISSAVQLATSADARTAGPDMAPDHVFRDCRDCPEMVVIPAGNRRR